MHALQHAGNAQTLAPRRGRRMGGGGATGVLRRARPTLPARCPAFAPSPAQAACLPGSPQHNFLLRGVLRPRPALRRHRACYGWRPGQLHQVGACNHRFVLHVHVHLSIGVSIRRCVGASGRASATAPRAHPHGSDAFLCVAGCRCCCRRCRRRWSCSAPCPPAAAPMPRATTRNRRGRLPCAFPAARRASVTTFCGSGRSGTTFCRPPSACSTCTTKKCCTGGWAAAPAAVCSPAWPVGAGCKGAGAGPGVHSQGCILPATPLGPPIWGTISRRDLKPQNIMLASKSGAGLLKIADLGVSAELALVFTKVQIGTPHYMAPGAPPLLLLLLLLLQQRVPVAGGGRHRASLAGLHRAAGPGSGWGQERVVHMLRACRGRARGRSYARLACWRRDTCRQPRAPPRLVLPLRGVAAQGMRPLYSKTCPCSPADYSPPLHALPLQRCGWARPTLTPPTSGPWAAF